MFMQIIVKTCFPAKTASCVFCCKKHFFAAENQLALDLMPRNIDHRLEVTCPIFDKNIKEEIKNIFNIQWRDNVKARIYDATQSNEIVKSDKQKIRSQIEVYNYIRQLNRSDNKTTI